MSVVRSEGFDGKDEIVSVRGLRGVLVNKREIENFSGPIPLNEYAINDDPNPRVIRKTLDEPVKGKQQVTIRYLEPPPPPPSGEIIIQQEKPVIPPPAPPIVIREVNQTASKYLEPKVIREVPPKLPPPEPRKIIKILPAKVPPPPRKIIVEKMPAIDEQTQPIIIERWLAPKRPPRRVIFDGVLNAEPVRSEPVRNEIIQYEAPRVLVSQEVKEAGVVRMDPNEYYARYRDSLVDANSLPQYAREVRPPPGYVLASDPESRKPPPLEGDVHILTKIDLEREGLGEYKVYVNRIQPQSPTNTSSNRDYTSVTSNPIGSSGSHQTPSGGGTIGSMVVNSSTGSGYPNGTYTNGGSRGVSWSDQNRLPPSYDVRTTTTVAAGGQQPSESSSNYYERRTTVYRTDSSSPM